MTTGSRRLASNPNSSCCSTLVKLSRVFLPQYHGEKRVVFLAILAVATMVIWDDVNEWVV